MEESLPHDVHARSRWFAYGVLIALLAVMALLHLGTFLLTSLFGYLVLEAFCIRRNKALSVALYLVAVALIVTGLIYFSSLAYRTFPKIAETSIPAMAGFAEKNGIELPFTDYDSLKAQALGMAQEGATTIGRYAKVASFQLVLLLAGLVVAVSVFLNPSWSAEQGTAHPEENLYTAMAAQLGERFQLLYRSFARVIGAQLAISAINTVLTAIFLIVNGYPHIALLVIFVFLCGLLPIVGNLISNFVIMGVGFTISPHTGLFALVFLVVIHKLEYFLNSKIIGKRIDSPMWLTLIGLVLGERLMGIPGMILAPVFLHYLKIEISRYPSPDHLPPAES